MSMGMIAVHLVLMIDNDKNNDGIYQVHPSVYYNTHNYSHNCIIIDVGEARMALPP